MYLFRYGRGVTFAAQDLVSTLAAVDEDSYVRVVAQWLVHGRVDPVDPGRSGRPVVDALVAAATAHLARQQGVDPPRWTAGRALDAFWHPGDDRFFAYSLAHAPAEFAVRGVIVERDSLVSV